MAKPVVNFVYKGILEPVLLEVGLLTRPTARFFVVSAVTAAVLYYAKPRSLFRKNGTAKPWTVSSNERDALAVPALGVSGIVGLVSVLLI